MKSYVVDYSNEASSVVFSQGAFYLVWNSNFESADKVVSHHGTIILINVLTFESVDKILWCYHSIDTSSEVFSHGTT